MVTKEETTALVPSLDIRHFLEMRQSLLDKIEAASELLQEADLIAQVLKLGDVMDSIRPGRHTPHEVNLTVNGSVLDFKKYLDALGWTRVINETGARTFLNSNSKKRWDLQIEKLEVPELTAEAIASTVHHWRINRPEMMELGILEIFQKLSWNYMSNLPQKFGRKIILENAVRHTRYGFDFGYHSSDKIDDINRVMHIFDGQPEPDHRTGSFYTLNREVAKNKVKNLDIENSFLEMPYFTLKWYKKGTMHLVHSFHQSEIGGKN